MFCKKCGAENPDSAKFCKGCGDVINNGRVESRIHQKTAQTFGNNKKNLIGVVLLLIVLGGAWFGYDQFRQRENLSLDNLTQQAIKVARVGVTLNSASKKGKLTEVQIDKALVELESVSKAYAASIVDLDKYSKSIKAGDEKEIEKFATRLAILGFPAFFLNNSNTTADELAKEMQSSLESQYSYKATALQSEKFLTIIKTMVESSRTINIVTSGYGGSGSGRGNVSSKGINVILNEKVNSLSLIIDNKDIKTISEDSL